MKLTVICESLNIATGQSLVRFVIPTQEQPQAGKTLVKTIVQITEDIPGNVRSFTPGQQYSIEILEVPEP